jgi:hypothetical protein
MRCTVLPDDPAAAQRNFISLFAGIVVALHMCSCAAPSQSLRTGLEKSHYQQLTSSAEIDAYLAELSRQSSYARVTTIGASALGKRIAGLVISKDVDRFLAGRADSGALTVLLIGSQHGSEPSGAEALLLLARDLVQGALEPLLAQTNFVLIPNSNPDGRDRNRRVNGDGVNLSTDFAALNEPESRAMVGALHRWKPHVVLDIHESAVLKKKSLGAQGYLSDFECQFEGANNPNVAEEIRSFTYEQLLPDVIDKVSDQGLPAQRYIGEITDIRQPITHGGLSLRNMRNLAGMMGAFSFLVENRLDPSTGTYSTPRNIEARVAKQYLAVATFLRRCIAHRAEIVDICARVRRQWEEPRSEAPLLLSYGYAPDPDEPEIILPMRALATGEQAMQRYRYFGAIVSGDPVSMPTSYIVTSHQSLMKEVLDGHRIRYQIISEFLTVPATIRRIIDRRPVTTDTKQHSYRYVMLERAMPYTARPGDLLIPLDQPSRRLIPLLLEPRSMSSLFNAPGYSDLVQEQRDFFIHRTP